MFTDIVGNFCHSCFRFVEGFGAFEFAFEVGFLVWVEVGGDAIEPFIDGFGVFEFAFSTFVENWDDGLVGDGGGHGVAVDEAAEFLGGAFVFFEEWSSGEADVAGVGEDVSHFGVGLSVLGAVGFIDEDEDVGAGVLGFFAGDGFKFVDDGGDDFGFRVVDELEEMFAALGLDDGCAAVFEGVFELVVEVDAIVDEDDFGIEYGFFEG